MAARSTAAERAGSGGSSFSGNAAAHNGGALCLDANDGEEERTVNVEGGCSFTGNSAGTWGAVYVSGGVSGGSHRAQPPVHGFHPPRFLQRQFPGVPRSLHGRRAQFHHGHGPCAPAMHADPDCLVSMEDPLYSFAGYSSTSSLRKTGKERWAGISLCHFPVSVEGGGAAGTNAGARNDAADVAAGHACPSLSPEP
ncbi:MAG: hypothetical protein ACLT8E_05465 [Akkermansia sp.]